MLKIKLINVPYKDSVLGPQFSARVSINTLKTIFGDWSIVEGGMLDNTTFRIDTGHSRNAQFWCEFTHESGKNAVLTVVSDSKLDYTATIRMIRALRNYCESFDESPLDPIDKDHPTMVDYVAEEALGTGISDELVKAITPTTGFAQRQYVLNDPGEPFFVLLGRDPQAPKLLQDWALLRSYSTDPDDKLKVEQVMEIVTAMKNFKEANPARGLPIDEFNKMLSAYENSVTKQ